MAEFKAILNGYMTVGEVAKKMGVTVRALQYYDREGLLSPSSFSDGGRRLYGDEDVVKLHQILTLKSLGFSLDKIKNHLVSIDTPQKAMEMLTEQETSLQTQIDVLTQSLRAIELLKKEIEQMQTVDFSKYADIIVNLQMGNKYYGFIKHFDETMLDHCHKKFDQTTGATFIEKFNKMIEKMEKCIETGVAPESKRGQEIANEFWQLITEFTDGDMRLLPKLMNFGNAQTGSEEELRMQNILHRFIEPALSTYFEKSGINPFEVNHE